MQEMPQLRFMNRGTVPAMPKLTPEGEKVIAALAERYAMGVGSVKLMLDAVAKGGGSMAQFNLPELGGGGQWMRGGMTMVGDMFNNSLKAAVDNLCNELSRQPGIVSRATQIWTAPLKRNQVN